MPDIGTIFMVMMLLHTPEHHEQHIVSVVQTEQECLDTVQYLKHTVVIKSKTDDVRVQFMCSQAFIP